MREHAEYKGRDIRAVENPYEAAFELSGQIDKIAKSTGYWIIGLNLFFSFYIVLTIFVVYLNIYVFNQSDLRYLGIAMGLVNIILGAYSLSLLGRSYSSLGRIYQDHGLLERIDRIDPGKYAKAEGTGKADQSVGARDILDSLIDEVGKDSEKLFRTFRFVYLFIFVWMINAAISYVIQFYRFGPNFLEWKLDWLTPGGSGLDAILFLVFSIFAYRKVRDRFDFISRRHGAIVYALNRPRSKVPTGANPFERYKGFLSLQDEYHDATGWRTATYFNGVFEARSGTTLVKALDTTPDADALAEFVRHARAQGGNVRHAVLLYPEDPDKPLPESVYNEVVNNPVRVGKELFTVELVMEGRDGFYDFIPVVSP